MNTRHPERLRRIALRAQGLLSTQAFGRGQRGAQAAIEHLGHVQIDTISVVERAHHHVLFSRVPDYQPDHCEQLLQQGRIFEYWAHAAAFLPMTDFRYSLPYKSAIKAGQTHWFKNPDRKLMRELLARIRNEGPLRSRDLEAADQQRAGWWDWKPAKKALEQLYMQGDLMVSDRSGFQKTYDLTERVLPADIDTRTPNADEFAAHVLQQQLRCQGLATLRGLSYHVPRNPALRSAMKNLVAEKLSQKRLIPLQISSGETFLLTPETLGCRQPAAPARLQILSPFDNAVIQRERLAALFDFDYRIECYVPAAKRQYGYFALPLLYRDVFVGRMDCKAHRARKVLEIKSLQLTPDGCGAEELIDALAKALNDFLPFQGCAAIELGQISPAELRAPLRKALNN